MTQRESRRDKIQRPSDSFLGGPLSLELSHSHLILRFLTVKLLPRRQCLLEATMMGHVGILSWSMSWNALVPITSKTDDDEAQGNQWVA